LHTPFPNTVRHRPRTVVIGGGVNGLGIAWMLARAGCTVDVFDAGEPGAGASRAAAGMLAAGAEAEPGEEALTQLGRMSQRLWPEFAEAVHAASGIDPEYRTDGLLVAAITHDEAARVSWNYQYQQGQGVRLDWLTGAQLREREPHLTRNVQAGVVSPDDHQVNNRALVQGLRRAAEGAGARIHAHAPVEAVVSQGGRATGVRAGGETLDAEAVVLAAGAWSRGIAGVPEAARPPVRPVKGQMLSLRMDPEAPLLRHVLWAPTVYLVPRRDGTLVVGGTVEENGFDTTITAGGLYAILQAAWRAVPAIEELPVVETWVGFRPTSRDDAPILGRASVEGLWLATGHHRNGILLAPVTARAVAAEILGAERVDEIAPFGPERFTRGREAAMEAP